MSEAVDELMIQAQVFASAWSLVGGRFDTGHCSDAAKEAKLELEEMVRAALAAAPAQERIQALELEVRQLTEQIAWLRHAPTPQADSQPAPVREGEWINDAGRIKWLMWRVQDLEAKLAARAPADSVLEDADPLQGAANWLAQAHGQFCVAVLQGCLMIGYNRAKRLHDASIAARKQGANHD